MPDRPASDGPPRLTRVDAGRGGRRHALALAFLAVSIGVAIVKPWESPPAASPFLPPGESPGPSVTAVATPGLSHAPSPAISWLEIGERPTCVGVRSWVAVSDVVAGDVTSRTWSRIDPVEATGPRDARIPRIPVTGDQVLRLGFCAALPSEQGAGAGGGGGASAGATPSPLTIRFAAWRIRGYRTAGATAEAISPILLGADSGDANGRLFGPPGGVPGRGWEQGTYVFRVVVPGVGGGATAWFAADVLGPWKGPDGGTESGQ